MILKTLNRFYLKKKVSIKFISEVDSEMNDVLYSLASFMGNNYSKIHVVYKALKSKLSTGGKVKIHMKDQTQESISYSCQLCHNLYEIAFLSHYNYLKSPRYQIIAAPNRFPVAINFLTGHWLECYVNEIKTIIKKFNIAEDVSFLLNPQIILPNGDDFELDVLFSIGDEIYWIEAKTGEYHNYLEKYSNVAKLLNSENLHPYMILTEVPQATCYKLSNLFRMDVFNIKCFSRVMEKNLEKYKNDFLG